MEATERKRRGRPPGKSAPLTTAERVKKHRARKRAERIAEIESDPQRIIAYQSAALEAANATIAAAAEKIRERMATIDEMHRKLAGCEQNCSSLRRDRDLRDDEIEGLRVLMRGQLSENRIDEFFMDLYETRRQAGEPW
jgi:hypothetical protein